MLILTRKLGEKLVIGDNIIVEVRRIRGNQVSLAVDAPRLVPIVRGEIRNQSHPEENSDDRV